MSLLSPSELARTAGASGAWDGLTAGTGVAFNSADVRPGDVFFALPGAHGHGMLYAQQALKRGAAFILSDRPHPQGLTVADPAALLLDLGRQARSRLAQPVIGVTGSVGKTGTKALLAAALDARSTPGNYNTPNALARTLIDAALAADSGQPAPLVLELGIDHQGEMQQLTELTRPDHAIITAIAAGHLEGLGDVTGVAREKGALFQAAPGHKVIGAAAAKLLPAQLLAGATVAAGQIASSGPAGSVLHAFGREIRLPWPGRPAAQNALLALTLTQLLGVPLDLAISRLQGAQLEGARLQLRQLGPLTLIDDSYNSNPTSLTAALELLRQAPAPRVAFLGDMLELGALQTPEHLAMGAATVGLEMVVGVGAASALIQRTNPAALWAPDAQAAARYLPQIPPAATVLIKGSRGVRMEQLVGRLEQLHAQPQAADA